MRIEDPVYLCPTPRPEPNFQYQNKCKTDSEYTFITSSTWRVLSLLEVSPYLLSSEINREEFLQISTDGSRSDRRSDTVSLGRTKKGRDGWSRIPREGVSARYQVDDGGTDVRSVVLLFSVPSSYVYERKFLWRGTEWVTMMVEEPVLKLYTGVQKRFLRLFTPTNEFNTHTNLLLTLGRWLLLLLYDSIHWSQETI